jgi:superfamily II DNA or RNA helicase
VIVIRYRDNVCTLLKGNPSRVTNALKFDDPGARFVPAYQHGGWDGKVLFYDWKTRTFPSGLLPDVEAYLQSKQRPYRVKRPKRKPVPTDTLEADCLEGITLRDYQHAGAKALLEAERGWLWDATNAGKTPTIAAALLHVHRHLGGKQIMMVPNSGLCIQTARELKNLIGGECTVGSVGGGTRRIGDITVVTAQSLIMGVPAYIESLRQRTKGRTRRRLNTELRDLLLSANMIVIDEGHHASAETWKLILGFAPARLRAGLTGSFRDVHKGDGESIRDVTLRAYVGPLIRRIKNSYLVNRGFSARPIIYCISDAGVYATDHTADKFMRDRKGRPIRDDNDRPVFRDGKVRFREEITSLLNDSHYNSAIVSVAEAMNAGGLKPLILTHSITHLQTLVQMFRKRGVLRPISVWGDIPAADRVKNITQFNERDDAVLIGSTVFDEGMNVPAIGCMILASGGKGLRAILQRIGRSLRRKKGSVNMVAVVDMTATNGDILQKHSDARLDVYFAEKFTVKAVDDLGRFLRKARRGWCGLLGKKRYAKERERTRRLSEKEAVPPQASGPPRTP